MMILYLTLFGALILLDKYAIGEFGFSQPIIAATIIGALCGDVRMGIFIGAMFQLLFLANLPIGKDVPPDVQTAGVAGCGSYFILKQTIHSQPNLLLIFLIGILASVLGSLFDTLVRRLNEQLYYRFLRNKSRLIYYHFLGIVTSFLRGVILLLPLFGIISLIAVPAMAGEIKEEFLMIIVVSIGVANGLYIYLKKESFYFLIIGVICSIIFFIF